MPDFSLKMQQIQFRLLAKLSAPQDPLPGFGEKGRERRKGEKWEVPKWKRKGTGGGARKRVEGREEGRGKGREKSG